MYTLGTLHTQTHTLLYRLGEVYYYYYYRCFVFYTSSSFINNRHVRDDPVGVSTAVSVMSVVQSESQFSPAVDIRGCFTISLPGARCASDNRLISRSIAQF